jgi:hypothetical protein
MKTLEYVRAEDQLPDQVVAPGGSLDPAALVGMWHATDEQSTGVVRLELRKHEGVLLVRAFGADPAEPYDWGEAEAMPYGSGVTASTSMAFTAVYDFGFLVTIMAAHVNQGVLVVDTFNTFTDSSGRANYFSREFFHR